MAHEGWHRWVERTAETFSMPPELDSSIPVIELLGHNELHLSNHRGIVSYGTEEIGISGGRIFVRIEGEGLKLRSMSGSELFITGRITSVHLE